MGILVLGMHRSGTSATTEAMAAVTENTELPTDDFPPVVEDENPRGYFESQSLTGFNDLLLSVLGGDVFRPPKLTPGWVEELFRTHATQARTQFAQVFRTDNWIWKDPRSCLTAPFWLRLLDYRIDGVVIVWRHPVEVAESMANSRGVSRMEALELWRKYTESAVASARGMRTFVSSYATLLDEPECWLRSLDHFVEDTQFHLVDDPATSLSAAVSPVLHHFDHPPGDLPDVTPAARRLLARLKSLEGVHDRFP